MRLFIAIDIPKEIENKIRTSFLYAKDVLEFAQFIEPENLHITLAFFGELPESFLGVIKTIIGNISKTYTAKDLIINDAVIGPDETRARMIWLKFDSDSQNYLEKIAHDLKKELKEKNIPFDNTYETLNGHLTLARFGQRWQEEFQSKNSYGKSEELAKIKETFPENFSASFGSKGVALFLSHEKDGRRIYEPLFESNFKE